MARRWWLTLALVLVPACSLGFDDEDLQGGPTTSANESAAATGGTGGTPMSTGVSTSTTGQGGSQGGASSIAGCSDGTREAFADSNLYPDIAGCSGGWSIPGVVTPESLSPQCGRMSGNTGANVGGTGCSVADLCAEGWHVCESSVEVSKNLRGDCDLTIPAATFFATRQATDNNGACGSQSTATNNLVGCGNEVGIGADVTCIPLKRTVYRVHCNQLMGWNCGTQVNDLIEAQVVVKSGSDAGGVLCCAM